MSKIRLNLDINQLIDHELCFVLKVKRFDKINCCYAHLRYKPLKSIETFEKNENAYAFFFIIGSNCINEEIILCIKFTKEV